MSLSFPEPSINGEHPPVEADSRNLLERAALTGPSPSTVRYSVTAHNAIARLASRTATPADVYPDPTSREVFLALGIIPAEPTITAPKSGDAGLLSEASGSP